MGSRSSKERIEVPESFVTGFNGDRMLYFWLILIVSVIAVVGNILAVRSVIFKKYKYLQKTCVISLAISDLMTVILFAMNNLDLLSKNLVTWAYGEFLCHYLPVGQVLGNLASSLALLVIALDRYHNVIHALSKKWDPSLWKCLVGALVLWILCIGLSYPVVTFYIYFLIRVNDTDAGMCYGAQQDRQTIMIYYTAMNVLFFFPIISLFFWFYYKIALLIWRHRKPVTSSNQQGEVTENSSTGKATQESSTVRQFVAKKKNIQMERKKRSFKIVLVLIFAFLGCRMPYWLFMVYKLVITCASQEIIWKTGFLLTALNLLNCALNPFLYTYLNITIVICRKINDFMCKICCCCFSNTEFEDFETGNGAEGIMGYKKNIKAVREKILDKNEPKIQFLDVPDAPKYTQKEIY